MPIQTQYFTAQLSLVDSPRRFVSIRNLIGSVAQPQLQGIKAIIRQFLAQRVAIDTKQPGRPDLVSINTRQHLFQKDRFDHGEQIIVQGALRLADADP